MYYYFVWVRSNRYHGSDPLTYSSEQKLTTGSVVRVELQRQVVMGVVSGVTTEPRFKTKPITEIVDIPLFQRRYSRQRSGYLIFRVSFVVFINNSFGML